MKVIAPLPKHNVLSCLALALLLFCGTAVTENGVDRNTFPFIPKHPRYDGYHFLLEQGTLYEGIGLEQAQYYLGKPTQIDGNLVIWYHNTGTPSWHVFPYINARLRDNKLFEWKTAVR
jgi:hypothetical protein